MNTRENKVKGAVEKYIGNAEHLVFVGEEEKESKERT